ncbi:MAG: penicillin acylase family protein [Bacteroidetes bacterium]|nr:penicillin acylase family protein [Bacteroidota bacterium]
MKKSKIIFGVTATLIIFVIALVLFSYYMLGKYMPVYEGEVEVAGITNTVKIYRDSVAVAYIDAETELDASFALGFVHAQERLFQMDMLRRAGEGRLSEILGSKTIEYDKMFKTLELYETCVNHYNQLSEKSRSYLEAYAKGVNAFIKEASGHHSLEFDVLGYDPYEWKPEHSYLVSKFMAWQLNIGWWSDISFAHLIQNIDPEKVKEIIPDYEENAPTIIPTNYKNQLRVSLDYINLNKEFREFFGLSGTHIGSNNWVVNGEKSESGKVIIANDPHLGLKAPGTWLVVVIKSDNWNVSGFTLPGSPGVVIGKNDNISWVLTNVMADDCDLYLENINNETNEYLLDGMWKKLSVIKDTINVKDSSSVIFDIRKTHRGPIINDIHYYNTFYKNGKKPESPISMRWTAHDFSDEVNALLLVNYATDWESFKEGVKHFTVPGQNFVYGDKDGNIGYICAAKLPIRNNLSPTMVYDGTTTLDDWKGFVPFEEMPMLFNPAQNYIASANNKTIKDFRYHITNTWEPPSRIKRIEELLTAKEKHNLEDFKKYQNDLYSHHARVITPYILDAFKGFDLKDKNLKLSLELLKKWDFVFHQDSQVPAIFAVFYQNLLKEIFQDEMGEEVFKEYVFLSNVPYRVIKQLLQNPCSDWFDNVNTRKREARDEIIRKSLADALTQLEQKLGANLVSWQWGKLHTVTFEHPFHGISSVLDELIDIGPFPIGGDGTTVFNTEYSFTEPYKNTLGPSMRFLYDFNNPDVFEFITTTGQSGHIISDHYNDMTQKWLSGDYIKVNTDFKSNESDLDLLLLVPSKGY